MTNRIEHIDIAKGICIILVALYHSNLKLFAPEIMYSMGLFRLPLFFFLSGVFLNASTDVPTFLWKKSDALLKPYFFTLVIVLIVTSITEEGHIIEQLKRLLYGNGHTFRISWVPMWFLPHLFSVYCFAYFFLKITSVQEKHILYKVAVLIIFMVIGVKFIDLFWHVKIILWGKEVVLPGLPFSFDIVLVSSSFFIMGGFLRKNIINFKPTFFMLYMSVLFFIAIAILTDAYIHLYMRIYTNPLFATLGAICGIYFVISASFYINKITIIRNVFVTFGQASLFILIFHKYIGSNTYNYISEFSGSEFGLGCAILAFLISITVPILIGFIVSKNTILSFFYFPFKSNKTNSLGR